MQIDHALPWGAFRPRGLAAACIGLVRHRIARGALRKPVYWVLEKLGPFFDVEVDGLRLRCRVNDNWTETGALFYGLQRFPELARIVADLKPGDTFVDAGANSGLFALQAARVVGLSGTVVAIEPNPLMVDRLQTNARLNGFDNIRVVPRAVGATSETATLYTVPIQQGRTSLRPVRDWGGAVKVKVEPLLSILQQNLVERIDALKIDIEGYEDRALIPFFKVAPMSLWPRRILIERSGELWERDCFEYLQARGYSIEWQNRLDVLLTREHQAKSPKMTTPA